MATYKGFTTIDRTTNFSLTDLPLIERDLMNALMIRQGEVPGKPEVGTTLWATIFEPLDSITRQSIEYEIRRVLKNDPRLAIERVDVEAYENTVVVELRLKIQPNMTAKKFTLAFDEQTSSLTIR